MTMGRRNEQVVSGLNAALAVARHRPEAIVRVFFHRARRVEVGPLLKAAAAARRPYREVPAEDLEKITQSTHHEGVAVVTTPMELVSLDTLIARPAPLLLALDGVGNPHNLGSILRSAAWFGADGLIFPAQQGQAALSQAVFRTAEGGAEVVACCGVDDLATALRTLNHAGIPTVGADQRATRARWDAGLVRPICLVLGSEGEGLSEAVRRACAELVAIPGSGGVESLNVGVAAGALLSRLV
jgi:TrmH RNA methyltransferase